MLSPEEVTSYDSSERKLRICSMKQEDIAIAQAIIEKEQKGELLTLSMAEVTVLSEYRHYSKFWIPEAKYPDDVKFLYQDFEDLGLSTPSGQFVINCSKKLGDFVECHLFNRGTKDECLSYWHFSNGVARTFGLGIGYSGNFSRSFLEAIEEIGVAVTEAMKIYASDKAAPLDQKDFNATLFPDGSLYIDLLHIFQE